MALPGSGQISLSQVNTELGNSATAQISLNDSRVRCLFDVASGPIDMNDGWGKNNTTTSADSYGGNNYDTQWTVPSGVTSITVKMWGGGGGGGHSGGGGTAAFIEATLNVSSGQVFYITTGNGGTSNVDDTEICADENNGGNPGDTCRNPNNHGDGGNATVFRRSTTYIMAGGGGGGSNANGGDAGTINGNAGNGSNDGGYSGGNGATTTSGYGVHSGASQADGQTGLYSQNFCVFDPCGTLTGRWGGGGGSGWRSGYGGNGAWSYGYGNGGGGGGATSGYSDGLGIISGISSAIGESGDAYYDGCGSGGGANGNGGDGKVVIIYGSGQKCP